MSLACESEIRVQNENALRFSLVSKPLPLLEYIKAIASLVGASHILAVFEEIDNLKVFFDDKRYVDTVIRSGVHVMGRHVRIDYVVAPGVKVILSNVDPILSNYDIVRLLSSYGSVVSPIIRPPICDDAELCHIGYGVRYAYMVVNECLPAKVEFKFGDQLCVIRLRVEDRPESFMIPYIKEDVDGISYEGESNPPVMSPCPTIEPYDALPGPSGIDTNSNDSESSDPVLVRVESAASVIIPQIECSTSLRNDPVPIVKRRGRKKGFKKLIRRRKTVTATTRAARRIKNFRSKYIVGKRHYKKRVGCKSEHISITECASVPVVEVSPSSSVSTEPIESIFSVHQENEEMAPCEYSSDSVLEPQKLLMYLDEVKHHRAPFDVAKKYLGENCNKDMLLNFIEQLHKYNASHNVQSLKLRILRLIKVLKDSI